MEDISLIVSRAVGEALNNIDASTLIFLTVANLVQLAVILFLVIVAPIWIVRHYNARRDEATNLADREKAALERLEQVAERMDSRLVTVEKILDADDPNWRERV